MGVGVKGIVIEASTAPLVNRHYLLSIELNTTDVMAVEDLRNISYPISISSNIQISDVNISTVCSSSNGDYQCRCEDEYRWSCDQCLTYGSCDNITDDTCGCISGIPADGQYCQALDQNNFTACPITTTSAPTSSTAPSIIHHYLLSIELNTTDVTAVEELRNISYPVSINSNIQISDVNITTVCSPSSGDYHCRCEDQYRWPCDQCLAYGSCDIITDDTCGCIHGIPADRQYCQSEEQYNFTACPQKSTTVVPKTSVTSPEVRQYLLSFELKTSDVRAIGELRNISYPIGSISLLLVSDVNISAVCSPNNTRYQCRCEDQYGWPCDMCSRFGKCSNILDSTCGCISALPLNNTYCQPLSDLDSCPTQTPTAEPTVTSAIITNATVVTNSTPVATTSMNTTTAATTVIPKPTVTSAIITNANIFTNSTPVATTFMNTTTAATTVIPNSTPEATTFTVTNMTTPVTS